MSWMHWIVFAFLSVLALGMATDKKTKTSTRLASFVLIVGLILLLVLGQRQVA